VKVMKWMHPEISLERWIQPSQCWGWSPGWKPGWKATWAAGGRPWTGWEKATLACSWQALRWAVSTEHHY
jgi:hypothetical protein